MYAVHFVHMYFTSHQLHNGKLLHFDDEALAHETLTCPSLQNYNQLSTRFVHVILLLELLGDNEHSDDALLCRGCECHASRYHILKIMQASHQSGHQ